MQAWPVGLQCPYPRKKEEPMHRTFVAASIALLAVLAPLSSPSAQAQELRAGALPPSPIYGRLGIGYSKSTGADIHDNDPNAGAICGDPACNTPGKLKDVGGGFALQAGVGYRYTPMFRGDLTFE